MGSFKYLDTEGNVHDDPQRRFVFFDRVWGRMEDFLAPGSDGLKDHDIGHYVRILTAQC